MKAPLQNPLPNQVVTHYEVYEPEVGDALLKPGDYRRHHAQV